MKKILATLTILILLMPNVAQAQDIHLEVNLERNTASTGNPLYLRITLHGTSDNIQTGISSIDGLQIKYVGPSTEVAIVNGVVTKSITHAYLIIPRESGTFKIGPFSVEHRGKIYKADAVILTISDIPSTSRRRSATAPSAARVTQGLPVQLDDRVFVTMNIGKEKVYINEIVPLTIEIYANKLDIEDIQYPSYPHEGFSAGEFAKPEKRWQVLRGVSYDVLTFRQDLFGIKEGKYVLGPAKLRCKVLVKRGGGRRSSFFNVDDFFGGRFGYQAHNLELESDEIPVTILPFPKEGRPSDFKGTVGDFSLEASVTPREVKVGDPVVLRMTIRGGGNLDTVTAPALGATDKIKTYEPQVTKKGNKKIYEQVLILKTDSLKEIPAVSFSFFDPTQEKYKTLRKGPFPIDVIEQSESERTVKMVSIPGVEQMFYPQEELGRDIVHLKENIGDVRFKGQVLYKSWMFWASQIIPLMFLIIFYVFYKKRERILTDKSYARFLKAPRKAKKGLAKAKTYLGKEDILLFYDTIFQTFQEYLGGRFNLSPGNITNEVIETRLRPAGCEENILKSLRDIFSKCEMARYASSVSTDSDAEEILEKVKRIIDYLEKIRL